MNPTIANLAFTFLINKRQSALDFNIFLIYKIKKATFIRSYSTGNKKLL